MFDTNIFNAILTDSLDISSLHKKVQIYVTHIQLDELNKTSNVERKSKLLRTFENVIVSNCAMNLNASDQLSSIDRMKLSRELATKTLLWGKDKWGGGTWGATGDYYESLKASLDKLKKKPNNIEDALIAETALMEDLILVTHDVDLAVTVKDHGGLVHTLDELLTICST